MEYFKTEYSKTEYIAIILYMYWLSGKFVPTNLYNLINVY